jgi:NADH-quinone oxidoreductase subunit J
LPPIVPPPAAAVAGGNSEQVGTALYTAYLLPFEIASILLLVAIVGAVVLAKKRTPAEE